MRRRNSTATIFDLRDGCMIWGQPDGEELVLGRRVTDSLPSAPTVPHYGGPLAEGLIVGDTVRCPWHRIMPVSGPENGEALRAPALDLVPC
ncbi:MAG TPA: Rieske 2Fe-2S domain-containing protein [Acidobacteriaceae bacterium]|nr:Rieske 2Fe-2S domain-containing protein [Acidobacteriaceae bacterium]